MTTPLLNTAANIARIAKALAAGEIAALPTETVYGLAADAANAAAVAKIYKTKSRPQFNPLIAHVINVDAAQALGRLNDQGFALADAFWPGPMTLVLRYHGGDAVCDLARAGLQTIGIRVPAHPVMRDVLRSFGGALVAPSANRSGHVSATQASHVAQDFADTLALILDGGTSALGLESTIIDITGSSPALLRAGAIAIEEIESVLGQNLQRPHLYDPENPSSAGQMSRHYATRAKLRLNAVNVRENEACLAFGKSPASASPMLNLSPGADLAEAAANLFAHLRALDTTNVTTIAVMPIPEHGLGIAINDRLHRAALGSAA